MKSRERWLESARIQFPQYQWREVQLGDAAAVHAIYLASDEVDGTDIAWAVEDLERIFVDSWMHDINRDTLVAITADGQVAGYGAILANPIPEEIHNALLFLAVHPDHRALDGRELGLEEFFIRWMEVRGAQILAEITPDLAGALHSSVEEGAAHRAALLEARGFKPIRYFFRMQRDLKGELLDQPFPAGIRVVNYHPAYDRKALDALNEAFADHWNFVPVTEEDWQRWYVGTGHFRADLSYLALDGDEIAGIILVAVEEAENRRKGTNEGWINDLGTRPRWRRRGIASALLAKSLQGLHDAGLDSAVLGVDSMNPTGALRLYQRLGFQVIRRFTRYEKKV